MFCEYCHMTDKGNGGLCARCGAPLKGMYEWLETPIFPDPYDTPTKGLVEHDPFYSTNRVVHAP